MKFAEVENEYRKNKDLKKEDVRALMEWADKQPHLPKITELQIILFLHSCYYSNEAAKVTIDNYYTARTHCPEFFVNRDPKDKANRDIYTIIYSPLPILTHEKFKVIYAYMADPDPDRYNFNVHIKAFDMNGSTCLMEEGTALGYQVVSDLTGITFTHITKIGPMGLKKFFFYLQEGLPVRIKGFHFINIPNFMDKIMSLIRPFMKKELLDVLHLHTSNLETLYPFIPQECLPKEYGGKAPGKDELFEITKRKFESPVYQNLFLEQEKEVIDENRRPGKPKSSGDVFGVEGTFKKLDID